MYPKSGYQLPWWISIVFEHGIFYFVRKHWNCGCQESHKYCLFTGAFFLVRAVYRQASVWHQANEIWKLSFPSPTLMGHFEANRDELVKKNGSSNTYKSIAASREAWEWEKTVEMSEFLVINKEGNWGSGDIELSSRGMYQPAVRMESSALAVGSGGSAARESF